MTSSPRLYAHCRNCASAKPANQSMSDWARLDVFMTDAALQVWCKRCKKSVVCFTPEMLQELIDAPPSCDCCPGGQHVIPS